MNLSKSSGFSRILLIVIISLTFFINALFAQSDSLNSNKAYSKYLNLNKVVNSGAIYPVWDLDEKSFTYTLLVNDQSSLKYKYNLIERTRKVDTTTIVSNPNTINNWTPQQVGKGPFGYPFYERLSPDSLWFAHRKDNNLWLRRPGSIELIQLTEDGTEGLFWGEGFEWSFDGNFGRPWSWWSPNGEYLAVKRVDEREVPVYTQFQFGNDDALVKKSRFSKSGDPLQKCKLVIFNVENRTQHFVEDGGDPEQRIYFHGWDQDSRSFQYVTLDRRHKLLRLIEAKANSGDTTVLIEEKAESFHAPLWSGPRTFFKLQNQKQFLWISDRDGWQHIYLYNLDGTLINQVTDGQFPVNEILHINEDEKWIYFTAHTDLNRPYDLHLARIKFNGTGFEQLTKVSGIHRISFSPKGGFYTDTNSSFDRPPVTTLHQYNGTLIDTLAKVDLQDIKTFLGDIDWVAPEEIVVSSLDGTTKLHGLLYKPFNFDPTYRYPVIEYIYDAGYATVVNRGFSGEGSSPSRFYPNDNIDPLALAQLGYLVWVVDGPGSANRGLAFRDLPRKEGYDIIKEHKYILEQTAQTRPYMDLNRVGIFGISAGGGQTLKALVGAPDFYRVGVAISPPVDVKESRASGFEHILGKIDENPEAYKSKVLSNIEQLKGKLLIMQGTDDPIVSMIHTFKLIDKLIEANKPYDLVLLPGQGHLFQGKGVPYAREAACKYFIKNLPPQE